MNQRRVIGRPGGAGYDVVVVGARCAGAATALLLARAGLSVLAVDRSRYGTDTLSTHALTRPAVLLLSRWGVLDDVRAAGTPRVTRVAYHYGDDVVDIPIRPAGDVDGLYAPRRHVLDRILVDAAVRHGAEVRHHTPVRGLTFTPDGRVNGVVVHDDRGVSTVRAGMVIGADGARSVVARQVGASVEYTAPSSSATIYTYLDGLPDDAYRNDFRPGVSAGVIPTNDHQANVWVGMPMTRLHRDRPGGIPRLFTETLAAAAPDLAAATAGQAAAGRHATFIGRRGFARHPWGPGWALVGDAAYFKDPSSAHGMTDALIGAELLARAVLAAAGGEPEPAALAGYARQRHALIAPMIPAVEHAASFRWDLASLQRAHLDMNAAMRAEWEHLTHLGPLPLAPGSGSEPRQETVARSGRWVGAR
jgi:flavin-dependent dehydrogenase